MKVIGRRDRIDLPALGLFDIEAKVDTGAYSSALHCHEMKVVSKRGTAWLQYKLLDPSHPQYRDSVIETDHFRATIVKSSNGQEEHRYTIQTAVLIFGEEMSVDFTLTDRNEMKNPILLGRKFLYKRFQVDVARKNLSFKRKKKKSTKKN